MHRLGEVVDLFVVDLAVNLIVGVDFILAVGNYVRDDNFVVDHKAYVARENLVASVHGSGAEHLHAILFQHGLEGAHFAYYVFVFGVNAL